MLFLFFEQRDLQIHAGKLPWVIHSNNLAGRDTEEEGRPYISLPVNKDCGSREKKGQEKPKSDLEHLKLNLAIIREE